MDFIEILKAIVIGVVEGITEWLPISSTGHMILVDEFIRLDVSSEFWEMFLVVIQLGAICAVIVLFFNKLNPFSPSKGKEGRKKTWALWAKVVVGCIPAAVIGILFDDWFTDNFHNAITVAIALLVYGVAFIVVERVKGPSGPHKALGSASGRAIGGASGEASGLAAEAELVDRGARTGLVGITDKTGGTGRDGRKRRPARMQGDGAIGRHSPEAIEARAAILGEEGQTSALQSLVSGARQTERATPESERTGSRSPESEPRGQSTGSDDARERDPGSNGIGNGDVETVDDLGFGRALGIGAFQVLAIVPGTSRSGSTILGGRILGVSREAAAEFSFFLAIPVMFGWSLLKLVKGFVLEGLAPSATEWAVFVSGIIVAFAVSILAIRFLMSYIRKHSFEVFGWYRIVLGIVVLVFFAATGQLFIVQ